jgi:hypothetical protein
MSGDRGTAVEFMGVSRLLGEQLVGACMYGNEFAIKKLLCKSNVKDFINSYEDQVLYSCSNVGAYG